MGKLAEDGCGKGPFRSSRPEDSGSPTLHTAVSAALSAAMAQRPRGNRIGNEQCFIHECSLPDPQTLGMLARLKRPSSPAVDLYEVVVG